MPVELPGYYYDASANRYFKIQPNHIAPSGANYSRQAVNAQKNPLLNFERRLGNLRSNAGTTVAGFYAAGIRGADAIDDETLRGAIDNFAIAPGSGALLAAQTVPHPRISGSILSVIFAIPRRGRPLLVDDTSRDVQDWPVSVNEDLDGCLYDAREIYPMHWVHESKRISSIVARSPNLVAWASCDPGGDRSELGGACYDESQIHSVLNAFQGKQLLDLAVSPSSRSIAMATSDGVLMHSNFNNLFTSDIIRQTPVRGEQMVVEFRDEWVVMSGARNGRLMLCDVRSPDDISAVFRIQHSSAFSGLVAMPDGHQILVNGLQDMKIYDLRYAPAPTRTHSLPQTSKPRARSKRPAQYSPTTPVLTFNIANDRHQNQYGLGFAYDPELNVVVRASTDHVHNHRMGIWSALSGHLLKSPLNEHVFNAPVTCAQIARLRDGPKSILLASRGKLFEWSIQGRGFEKEQEIGP
ncbi:hypothetical protein LTR10_022425 [Elasticomyces elasticus]|uniref:DUF2415 domain-containing protein n=1 Tax=Exophiala sideris TaxID=1016849 RepID=A0ABR0JMJ6_9EURO|nr:hypothetical protein LTR10_022425 [Elasticomyces elasticus]KAK5037728.1 hypothetical protein LTS07_001195 [Exophiala sideris]KAK5043710.1 hypothetical protein LTR13_000064 [Exophiala sideris]KAK5067209.1 hypothetical protein LTR69_001196 [Exophiala sideris]KAK5182542.1 hypothetical protein LTR44_004933 [Eurotiomycetes sp. CCFEE 6388]